ncbi:hypothetical protein [Avrilella dinanensis]|uniref:hypothetical protein n=1 Tax=Avrilella dinanensis TaxID=2008672 RepID=UPI00240A5FB2|nr:hypothetical protein [Avrilella dinanensis]
MKQIPVIYKKVDYHRYGRTVGGAFSKGVLIIEENSFLIKPVKWKILEYLKNNSSLEFDNNQHLNIYKNQFQEYKIKYSTYCWENEVTLKIDKKYHNIIDNLILQRYKNSKLNTNKN